MAKITMTNGFKKQRILERRILRFAGFLLIAAVVFFLAIGTSRGEPDYRNNVLPMRNLNTPPILDKVGDPNIFDLTSNPDYGSLVNLNSFERLLEGDSFVKFITSPYYVQVVNLPNFTTFVRGGDFSAYFNDPYIGEFLSQPDMVGLMSRPDFGYIMSNQAYIDIFDNPIMSSLITSPSLYKIVQTSYLQVLLENPSLSNFITSPNLKFLVDYNHIATLVADANFSKLLVNPAMEQFVSNINFRAIVTNGRLQTLLGALDRVGVIDFSQIGGLLKNPDLYSLMSNGSLTGFVVTMENINALSSLNLAGLLSNPNLKELINNRSFTQALLNININGVLKNLDLSSLLSNANLNGILQTPNLMAVLNLPNIGSLLSNFNFMKVLANPSFLNLLSNPNFMNLLSNPKLLTILNNLNSVGLLDNFDLNKIFSDGELLDFLSKDDLTYGDLQDKLGEYMDQNNSSETAMGGSYNNDDCNCCVNPGGMLGQMTRTIMEHDFLKGEIVQNDLKPANQTLADSLREKIILRFLMIGAFMDGQNEVQSITTLQKLNAKAMRDYQVSEQICRFGSVSKGLVQSSNKAKAAEQNIMDRMVARQTLDKSTLSGVLGGSIQGGRNADKQARLKRVATRYCDPQEMNGNYAAIATEQGDIVTPFCRSTDPKNWNADIDAGKTLFGVSSTGSSLAGFGRSDDEQNLIDLGANLYGSNLPLNLSESDLMRIKQNGGQDQGNNFAKLMDMRSILAKHSVAAGSFAAIAGMKTAGNGDAKKQLEAVAKELGVSDQKDLDKLIGDNPSYYAQMDFLTKKLYQTPGFYANLYDTPSNVLRQQTALKAISLMQDRDIYESLQRSEMILSVILETKTAHMQARYIRNKR